MSASHTRKEDERHRHYDCQAARKGEIAHDPIRALLKAPEVVMATAHPIQRSSSSRSEKRGGRKLVLAQGGAPVPPLAPQVDTPPRDAELSCGSASHR